MTKKVRELYMIAALSDTKGRERCVSLPPAMRTMPQND